MNQLKVGALLSYISLGLSNVIGLIYTPYMLRTMGQSEYGLYALVASVVGYLTILDFGFGNAIVRYTAKYRAENKIEKQYSLFGLFFILYCLIAFIALIFGIILYQNTDRIFTISMTVEELSKTKIMIALLIGNIVFSFPLGIFASIISAYENFIFQRIIGLIRIVLNPIIMIIMLHYGYRAIGMIVVTTAFNVITLLINVWYCYYRLDIKVYFKNMEWSLLKQISIYSFWIFLNIIMDKIYWSTGQFVLGAYVGTTAVAVFAIGMTFQGYYMNFSTAISGVFLPRITTMISSCVSNRELSNLFIKVGRIQFLILSFILSGFIVFGKKFIYLWAGSEYEESYYIALIVIIPLTIPLIQNLGITILQAKNQLKFRSLAYFFIALCSLGITIPLSKKLGGIGAAMGTSIALIMGQIIVMNIYYYKRVGLDIFRFWKEILLMSFPPVIVVIVGYYINLFFFIDSWISFMINVFSFSVILFSVIWFFVMNSFEKQLIIKPLNSILPKFKLFM